MQSLRKRTISVTIALLLVLTITTTFFTSLTASASAFNTYAFIVASPNPIGVGQTAQVTWWINVLPPTADGATGDRWQNITVTITKPDGTSEVMGPYQSDAVGSNYFAFKPDQNGTYYFQMTFPGQILTGVAPGTSPCLPQYQSLIGNYYKPSTSAKASLTVQQQPITHYQYTALPTDYWARPIEGENRDWWTISGNWLQGVYDASGGSLYGGFNPYTMGPNTAHILWTKPKMFGGLIGGEFGSQGYSSGLSWGRSGLSPPVIMNGRLFYNTAPQYSSIPGFVCVDLRTGEELWEQNATITLGQIFNVELYNQHGGLAYLWQTGSTYEMRDAFSGDLILRLANASTGTSGPAGGSAIIFSLGGDMLVYTLDGQNNWLAMWNSSAIPDMYSGTTGLASLTWAPPYGKTLDWRKGIQWNKTLTDVPGTQRVVQISSDVIYARATFTTPEGETAAEDMAYSLKEGEEGRMLWGPVNRTAEPSLRPGAMGEGVYTDYVKEKMIWYGYDIYTGQQLWGPTEPYTNAWGMYYSAPVIAYGKLYATAYDGMHCYDIKNGTHFWDYSTGSSGFETPYGTWPLAGALVAADGKIYLGTGEHSPNQPLWTGERLHAVNASTGETVWSILGWYGCFAIADGCLVTFNGYDNQIYCFGKGQTATTVSASPKSLVQGTSVVIEGTVTDQSPGANGTPAISDDSMEPWMEHLYMQKTMPNNATGVPVSINVLDSNGNYRPIGTTTSDASGTFAFTWTPDIPGDFTVIANFAGSESYYPSSAETHFTASTPATTASPYPVIAQPPTEMYFALSTAALIVTIVVVGAAIVLLLRKRP